MNCGDEQLNIKRAFVVNIVGKNVGYNNGRQGGEICEVRRTDMSIKTPLMMTGFAFAFTSVSTLTSATPATNDQQAAI